VPGSKQSESPDTAISLLMSAYLHSGESANSYRHRPVLRGGLCAPYCVQRFEVAYHPVPSVKFSPWLDALHGSVGW